MDNAQKGAPVIPAGTEKTLYGGTTFLQEPGQAPVAPETDKSQKAEIENALQQALGKSPETSQEEGTTFQGLAAKKGFQSPDDLAKAYESLEADNTKARMTLAEVVKARQEAEPQEEDFSQRVETQEDALKVVERVVKKMTRPLEDRLELQNLFLSDPEAKNYASEMANVVKKNPGISWDAAYKVARYDVLDRQSREKGKQEAYQTIQQKQSVGVGSGKPSTQTPYAGRNLDDLIGDRSIPFSEVQKIMKERFSQ